jgi:outer membrane protein assembly factor BamB
MGVNLYLKPTAMKKPYVISFLLLISFIPAILDAQDWTQFRGKNLDCKVTGFKAPATWPASLEEVWKVKVGTGDATPVISDGKLFLHTRQGNDEVILCLDASGGKELWKVQYPAPAVTGPAASHPGPRSTPAISEGKVVVYGATGILTCLDAATGKVLWKKENPDNAYPQFFTGVSPLITGPNLVAVHTGAKDKGEVTIIDMKTGTEKWKWAGDGPSYASPSLIKTGGKANLLVQTEKNLISFDPSNGKVLWQMATPVQQRFYNCTSPSVDGSTIYVTGQGTGLKAVKAESAGVKEIWSNAEVGAKWNTPVLKDGYLYGFSDQKRLYCVNAATGATAWIDQSVNSDFATLLDCGEVLIGLPSTGNLLVFKADPKAYTEVAKYKVAETPVYSFPLVAGKNIYVKDAENLTMFRLP